MRDVFLKDDPENGRDLEAAERLAQTITFAEWKITNGPRPPLPTSRERHAYTERMQAFVKDWLGKHEAALDNVAAVLESSIAISGAQARDILESNGVRWSSISDLP
jgi:hypothetical protein